MPKKEAKPKGLQAKEETPAVEPVETAISEEVTSVAGTSELHEAEKAAEVVKDDGENPNESPEAQAEYAEYEAACDVDTPDEVLTAETPSAIAINGAEAEKLNEQLTAENVESLEQGKTLIVGDEGEVREATAEEAADIDEILSKSKLEIEDFRVVEGANSVSPVIESKISGNPSVGAPVDGAVEGFRFKMRDELKFLEERELKAYQKKVIEWAEKENLAGELILLVELRGKQNGDFRTYTTGDLALVVEAKQHLRVHFRDTLVFEGEAEKEPTVFIPGRWIGVLVKVEDEQAEAARREAHERRKRRYRLISQLFVD